MSQLCHLLLPAFPFALLLTSPLLTLALTGSSVLSFSELPMFSIEVHFKYVYRRMASTGRTFGFAQRKIQRGVCM